MPAKMPFSGLLGGSNFSIALYIEHQFVSHTYVYITALPMRDHTFLQMRAINIEIAYSWIRGFVYQRRKVPLAMVVSPL